MNCRPLPLAACLAALLLTPAAAQAQRIPHIGYACPAGGRQGTDFDVKLAGQYLAGVSEGVFTGQGVTARVVKYVRPLNGKEINLLRNRQRALQQGFKNAPRNSREIGVRDAADTNKIDRISRVAAQKELAEIRAKLANPKNRNRENRQLSEDVVLHVTIAPDAPPGPRELRLRAGAGLSNPVAFYVGKLPEFQETEPNEQIAQAARLPGLPLVVNGQIMPGDVDRFRVVLGRGTKLVVAARARALVPYLADAVPGWFQATLALYDKDGNELAYDDDFQFHPDPVLFYEIPRTGEYVLEIKDSIYRGREDFVYRIELGELPFVTGVFPLGGPVGAATTVHLAGWNLPRKQVQVEAAGASPGIRQVSVAQGDLVANPFPFQLDDLPETTESEPNNLPDNAGSLTLPVIVNGRIDVPDDEDCFRVQGTPGATLVAEVTARRLNSPLDSRLRVTDARGKLIVQNDDFDDPAAGLTTHQADSYVTFTVPADGVCLLHLTDTQHQGSPAHAYRLRVSAPRPDFALRVTPSTINLRPGGGAPVVVHAVRRDGFTNAIRVQMSEGPAGFVLNRGQGGWIPAGKDEAKLYLRAPRNAPRRPFSIHLTGSARVAGRAIEHPVVPADDLMQAFIYRHLVPAQELMVTVYGRPSGRPALASVVRNIAKGAKKPAKPKPKPATKPKQP